MPDESILCANAREVVRTGKIHPADPSAPGVDPALVEAA